MHAGVRSTRQGGRNGVQRQNGVGAGVASKHCQNAAIPAQPEDIVRAAAAYQVQHHRGAWTGKDLFTFTGLE